MIEMSTLFMLVVTGLMGILWWQVKRYITKVDDIDTRLVKVEVIMEMLGDIKTEIGDIRQDVAVIKSRTQTSTLP